MTAQEEELRAKPLDAGSLMFRYTEIYRLLRQKVSLLCRLDLAHLLTWLSTQLAVYDYYGWEVNDPGHLNWLRDEIATAKAETDSWHAEYVRLRCFRAALRGELLHAARSCESVSSARARRPSRLQLPASLPRRPRRRPSTATGATFRSRRTACMIPSTRRWSPSSVSAACQLARWRRCCRRSRRRQ